MPLLDYTETNLVNTMAEKFAAQLILAGYLVYWHETDVMQSQDAWYPEYSTQYATWLLDGLFSLRMANALGIVTLGRTILADRRYPVRPTMDGTVTSQDSMPVPVFAVEVGPFTSGEWLEIGSTPRYRYRQLLIYGAVRNPTELSWFQDRLAVWFAQPLVIDVLDHDLGSRMVLGQVDLQEAETEIAAIELTKGVTRYEVILDSTIMYIA